jgi:hypothetical protein
MRDLERLVTWDGIIPRKKRNQFRPYLEHENERVRAFARELEAADKEARTELRRMYEADELYYLQAAEEAYSWSQSDSVDEYSQGDDTDIPF